MKTSSCSSRVFWPGFFWTLGISLVFILQGVASGATGFDFNDGSDQGWTLDGAYIGSSDTNYDGPYASNFTLEWSDDHNYPTAPGSDPLDDSKGSVGMSTEAGHGLGSPQETWWIMRLHSPDLTESETWQNATGYFVKLSERMSGGNTTLYANLCVRVYDLDLGRDRFFSYDEQQPLTYGATWKDMTFKWDDISGFPANSIVSEVYIEIWGLIAEGSSLSGTVYLDEVTPFTDALSLTVPEGGTVQFQVRWLNQPSENVNVSVARVSGDEDITVQSGASLTFTPSNWDTEQTVTLAAAVDEDVVNGRATIRVSDLFGDKYITVTEEDNTVKEIYITIPGNATEGDGVVGGTVSISGTLNEDLVLSLVSSDVSEVTVPGSVTIAEGETSSAFNLTILDDILADGAQTVTVTASASGWSPGGDTITVADNDVLALVTNVASLTVPEGGTGPFRVKLSHQPISNVNVSVARVSGDGDITVESGSSLTFTSSNWNTYQTVTLAAAADADVVNGSATIRLSGPGISADKDITATEQDNTPQEIDVTIPGSATEGDGVVGGTVSISGTLNEDLVISLVSSDVSEVTVPASVTIAEGETSSAFDLTVVDDILVDGAQSVTVTASASGWSPAGDTITVADDDVLAIVTDLSSLTIPEGGTAPLRVKLSHQPGSNTSVSVTRASGDGDITVQSGSSLTFTPSDWNTYQTVTLAAADDADVSNGSAAIRLGAPGITSKDITANEQDGGPTLQIVSLSPDDQGPNPGRSANIEVDFSQDLDEALLAGDHVRVVGSLSGPCEGSISYVSATHRLTFDPVEDFVMGETISVLLSGNIPDVSGRWLDGNSNGLCEGSPSDDYTWAFPVTESEGLHVQIIEIHMDECPTLDCIVTVADDAGEPVAGLVASEFSVYEDEVAQSPIDVSFLEAETSAISVCLVMDYSPSMSAQDKADMEDAAIAFIDLMSAQDAGEVIKFSTEIEVMQAFTTNKALLRSAVETAPSFAGGFTNLYNVIYHGVTDAAGQSNRKAVVVMTDGRNNIFTGWSKAEVIAHAQSNGVLAYTIGLGSNIKAEELEEIADETGGLYYQAGTSPELGPIYEAISRVLKNQYTVSYDCESMDGGEHALHIMANAGVMGGSDTVAFMSCGAYSHAPKATSGVLLLLLGD